MRVVWVWVAVLAALIAPAAARAQGFDPAQMIDMDKVIRDAEAAGRADRAAAARADSIDPTSDVGQAVLAAFADARQARDALVARSEPGFFQRNDLIYKVRARLKDGSPTFLLLSADVPYAVTYPDRTIVISRRFVDGLEGGTIESNRWALRAVVAHELAHHFDGHAIFNWLATRGRDSARRNQAVAAATHVTRFLPFSFQYSYEPSQTYPNLRQHPPVYEFLADYWAYYILKEMKAPAGVMSRTLMSIVSASSEFAGSPDVLGLDRLVRRRAQCMVLLEGDFQTDREVRSVTESIPLFDALSIHYLATPEKYKHQVLNVIATSAHMSRRERDEARASVDEEIAALTQAHEPAGADARRFGGDAAYWFCAMAALAERDPAQKAEMQALFDAPDGQALANALVARQELDPTAPDRPILTFASRLDGLPLLEPAIAFRTAPPETRPDLQMRAARGPAYSGPRDGAHRVRAELFNGGLNSPSVPISITARLGDRPARLAIEPTTPVAGREVSGCAAADLADTTKVCDVVMLTGTFGHYARAEFNFLIQGPPLPSPDQRQVTLIADGCGPAATAPRCAIDESREDNNSVRIRIGALPNLAVMSRGSISDTGVSLTIVNDGYGPTMDGFVVDIPHGATGWTLSPCTEGDFAARPAECTGVRVPGLLAPGQSVQVQGWFRRLGMFDAAEPRRGVVIDYCPARADANATPDAKKCAIDELNETDNGG